MNFKLLAIWVSIMLILWIILFYIVNMEKLNDIKEHFAENLTAYNGEGTTGTVISTDGRCGPDHSNQVCKTGNYCSQYGWCGTTDKHKKNGLTAYNGEGISGTVISTDGRCGPDHSNQVCKTITCDQYGWCGSLTNIKKMD